MINNLINPSIQTNALTKDGNTDFSYTQSFMALALKPVLHHQLLA